MKKIAALFVQENGPYFGINFLDAYGINKDAKKYKDNFPVICHPPCERWGSYWFGGPSAKVRRKLGDDSGCFEFALKTVRKNGGIIEHPANSHAWEYFGLHKPKLGDGWIKADEFGFTCQVEQGNYGHVCRKPTWLYAVNVDLIELNWQKSIGKKTIDESFSSNEERRKARELGIKPKKRATKKELILTPKQFRDILIKMALSVYKTS